MKKITINRPDTCVFNRLVCEEDGVYKTICAFACDSNNEWILCSNEDRLEIPTNCPLLKNKIIQVESNFFSICEIEK